jgi:CubicO group peptidase (beta-lactamase class C family)
VDPYDAAGVGMSAERLARIGPFFRERYVDPGRLPGVLTLVARRGRVVHQECSGWRDVERRLPVEDDTVFRLYSMTKPVTSVALMQLYEEGRFLLDDPVGRHLPEIADLRVWADTGPPVPCSNPPTIEHLLTHTAGFTYGFFREGPVDALYRERSVGMFEPTGDLAGMITRLGELPLLFEPGTRWHYGVATDVCGRLVEVLSGLSLDEYFATRILEPLGMTGTGFWVRPDQVERFAACYAPDGRGGMTLYPDPVPGAFLERPTFFAGGAGLVGTAGDYFRFAAMLLNRGELDGVRVLGRKTVEFMTTNHLPGGADMAAMGQPVFNGQRWNGIGFGLGFSVVLDPAQAGTIGSPGEFSWGGAASTMFFVDPAEELIAVLLTQLVPSVTYPIRREMRSLVYQALAG